MLRADAGEKKTKWGFLGDSIPKKGLQKGKTLKTVSVPDFYLYDKNTKQWAFAGIAIAIRPGDARQWISLNIFHLNPMMPYETG